MPCSSKNDLTVVVVIANRSMRFSFPSSIRRFSVTSVKAISNFLILVCSINRSDKINSNYSNISSVIYGGTHVKTYSTWRRDSWVLSKVAVVTELQTSRMSSTAHVHYRHSAAKTVPTRCPPASCWLLQYNTIQYNQSINQSMLSFNVKNSHKRRRRLPPNQHVCDSTHIIVHSHGDADATQLSSRVGVGSVNAPVGSRDPVPNYDVIVLF